MGLLDSVTGFLGGGSESSSDPSKVASFQQPFLQDIFSRAQDLSNVEAGQTFAQGFQQPAFGAFQNLGPAL